MNVDPVVVKSPVQNPYEAVALKFHYLADAVCGNADSDVVLVAAPVVVPVVAAP